jgi:transposase-like protein
MPTNGQRLIVAAAVERATGCRYCTNCRKDRKVEGGKEFRGADGRARWRCETCQARREFARKGQ